ncbi:YraN family protein [Lachnospiraceae bacterium ZAX-1]
MMKNTSKETGIYYEKQAAAYFGQKGYKIVQQNFYSPFGEIDLIVRQGKYLIFVEVKYRSDERGGHPLEVIDIKKQKRLCKTAAFYCLRKGYPQDTPCRFDVLAILKDKVHHIENAFPYRE